MRIHSTILFFILAATVCADEPKFGLKAPKGWGGETITLPPGFAKDMSLKGVEHIRFAPGMMNSKSDTFFCYAFAFEVGKTPTLSEKVIKAEFLKYYRGLCTAVMRGDKPELDPSKFTMTLKKLTTKGKPENLQVGEIRYTSVLTWVEPFATKKTQKLNLEIHTRTRDGKNTIFACVSPQKPDAPIWKQLREIKKNYLAELDK